MPKNKFKEPKITINKVYTKSGDSGDTHLVDGQKVRKSSIRVKSFGEIDHLNVLIGNCVVCIKDLCKDKNIDFDGLDLKLNVLQHELFNLGNMIATKEKNYSKSMPRIDEQSIKYLEDNIDLYNNNLNSLNSFVLPGGHELNIRLHLARTYCRRCEIRSVELFDLGKIESNVVVYLNRLSDLLFVWSRWVNHQLKLKEVTWNPNFRE